MSFVARFRLISVAIIVLSLQVSPSRAQNDRDNYVSDASFTIATYTPKATDHSPSAMASAANNFLDSLNTKLRERVAHSLDSDERRQWTNLPADPNAGGVPLGDFSQKQVESFCDLMGALFSTQGYDKMRNIMLADDQLLPGGRPRQGFGTETFAVVIFGNPSETEPWAFQLDGHHIGVNVSVTGDQVTLSPSFIGTQPEGFKIADQKYRPLAGEIDDAFKLAKSLTEDQFRKALVSPKRGQLLAGPGRDGRIPETRGVSCAEFNESQKQILTRLISHWVNNLPPTHAERRMKQLANEIDQMHFAWYGPREPVSDASYAIQGPTLIVEYACQDLGGNPLNHLHTIYRDPTNEYGNQLK